MRNTSADLKSSYVIIRKEYAYLESFIRETVFDDTQDIQIFMDRRCGERRKVRDGLAGEDRRMLRDRRQSTPILDVVISLSGSIS